MQVAILMFFAHKGNSFDGLIDVDVDVDVEDLRAQANASMPASYIAN